jgi:spore germination protein GerM
MRRATRHLVGAVVLLSVAACSVDEDAAPRDIFPSDDTTATAANVDVAAVGTGRIYLVAPEVAGLPTRLRPVARDVRNDAARAVAALVAGPNDAEFTELARSALPAGLEVGAVRRRPDGIIVLDVNASLRDLSGDSLVLALAQIVYTVSAVDGVSGVTITVDGAATDWPAANGQLRDEPLTVYDFPGLEPSSQPAFPSLPD